MDKSQNRYFSGDLEKLTIDNNAFRRVIFTTDKQQLVLMSLGPKEEIGREVHPNTV